VGLNHMFSASSHTGAVSRVVLCSCSRDLATALRAALESPELELTHCRPGDSILELVIRRRPAVLVYELRATRHSDLAVLQLLKRAAPDVRMILIATGSLETERMLRELRPVYYAVQPVGQEEMVEAVRAALGERVGRRA
jgi:DNA-binding NtrC family response regulator